MSEGMLVGAIVLAAALFALYRLFVRPKCACGCDCAAVRGAGKDGPCSCGKR